MKKMLTLICTISLIMWCGSSLLEGRTMMNESDRSHVFHTNENVMKSAYDINHIFKILDRNFYFFTDNSGTLPLNVEGIVHDQDGEILIGVNI